MVRRISQWSASALLLGGTLAAFFGAWAAGALAFGSAIAIWGVGSIASGEDRAVGWVLVVVGVVSVLGVVGHLVSGVGV